jgi:Tol biopolymer transport system component
MSFLHPQHRGWNRLPIILWVIAGAGIGLAGAFVFFSPRVVSVAPSGNARTGSYASIDIQFSVPMDPQSAADHFSVEPAVAGDLSVAGDTLRFSPRAAWPAGTNVRVTIRSGARSRRGLALLAGRSWTFLPSLVRVAYIPTGEGSDRLMGISIEGGEEEILARVPSPIRDFDVSARGDFAVLSMDSAKGPGKLWISRLDGGAAQLLLDCAPDSCRNPKISPDGSRVAYVREPGSSAAENPGQPVEPSVELLSLADGGIRRVSPAGNPADYPIWSAQGWLSYFDGTRQMIVVDDLAGGQTAVPNDSGAEWAWLPDGSGLILPEILVEGESADGESSPRIFSRLVRIDRQTNRRTNLSGEEPLEDASPAVSPDGSRLAFSRNFFDERWTPGNQLWLMDLTDGSARPLSAAPDYSHSSIRWSPDGAQLAYMMFHETVPEDPPEIWCMNADGSDPQRLVVGGFLPEWIP